MSTKKMFNCSSISAGHEITLEAAETVLSNGGNAFDAAFVAGFTMFNSECCMASAGAGGFAMCLPKGGNPKLLDFFVQTPYNKDLKTEPDFWPIKVNFGNEIETFHIGMASIAVPGMIDGLFTLHKEYGSIPSEELLQIPMDYAKQGIKLNTFQAIDIKLLENIFAVDPDVRDVFFKDGKILEEGENLYMYHLPDFIQFMIDEGRDGFYKGEISKQVDSDSRQNRGFIRRQDFEVYRSIWRKPLLTEINSQKLYTPPAPSLGGGLLLLLFDELINQNKQWAPSYQNVYAKYKSATDISQGLSILHPELNYEVNSNNLSSKGTSHFNIVDQWGNAIALTCSIGEGSGYFIPNSHMQLNNMLGEDFLLPNGFHTWKENERLQSMMTPIIMTDTNGQFTFAAGSGGAKRIPFMIAQVIEPFINEGITLQEAVDRARVVFQDDTIHIENGFSQKVDIPDMNIRTWNKKSLFFGGVHSSSLSHSDDGKDLAAYGDPRRYGVGKVF